MIRLEADLTEMQVASGTARFYNKSSTGLIKATTPFGCVVAGPETTFDLYVGDKSGEVIALKGKVDFVHPSGDAQYEVKEGCPSLLADGTQIASGEGGANPEWDGWNALRDGLWTKRLQASGPSQQYLPCGLHDEAWALEENGLWETVYYEGSYRHFWRPIRVAPGWAPFTVGRWTDWYGDQCWIPGEPFGYLTHHYGNWVLAGGLWYWAPPVVSVAVRVGLPAPPLPPLPLLPIPFAWFPGRVCWIHSAHHVGWVPLAPFEPYYCHRHWGPHSIIVDHGHRPQVDHRRCRYLRHAVVIHRDHLYRVDNYRQVRIPNLDHNSLAHGYHFTNVPVPQKRHQTALKRIKEDEEIASRRERERENAQAIRKRLRNARQDQPGRVHRIEGSKVSRKLVPEKAANRPERETKFPEKPLRKPAEAKADVGQPAQPAKPEQRAGLERRIRPPRPARTEDMYTVQPGPARQRELKRSAQARREVSRQNPSGPEQQFQYRPQRPQGQWEGRATRPAEAMERYRVSQGRQGQQNPRPQLQRGPREPQRRARTQ
jgi:hypothetical protein